MPSVPGPGAAAGTGADVRLRAHRKVRHARADFLHRVSTRLVREHDVIVIEDLAVANMVRNRHLARAISDWPASGYPSVSVSVG